MRVPLNLPTTSCPGTDITSASELINKCAREHPSPQHLSYSPALDTTRRCRGTCGSWGWERSSVRRTQKTSIKFQLHPKLCSKSPCSLLCSVVAPSPSPRPAVLSRSPSDPPAALGSGSAFLSRSLVSARRNRERSADAFGSCQGASPSCYTRRLVKGRMETVRTGHAACPSLPRSS